MKVIPHLFKRLFYKNDTINELDNIFRIKFFHVFTTIFITMDPILL